MDARIELKARLAKLVTLTNEYIWYGIPTEYQEASQSRPSSDLKGIIIQRRGSGSDALRILILDMRFRRMTVLKLRKGSPYFTIPSRSSAHTATILVEELDLSAPRMPLIMGTSNSDSPAALANNIRGNIGIRFDNTGVMRALRSIVEGYKILHSSFCAGFRCKKIRELNEYNQAAPTILGPKENKITTVSEIIDVSIRGSKLRVLLLWPFGGINDKKWSSSKSILYIHAVLSANHYSTKGKILSLKGVRLLATRNGIKSLENPDTENKVDGDFRLTFNTREDVKEVYDLLLAREE
ncbi:hypothetical protein B0O99DRAFT_630379 [Bisporella sp. PMI_857]|nr:hypothetical protein B0O99DRAFT_630379 [Bisporella sp. PMI_857]